MKHSKTLSTLIMAQFPNFRIICRTEKRAEQLREMALKMNLKEPNIIVASDDN